MSSLGKKNLVVRLSGEAYDYRYMRDPACQFWAVCSDSPWYFERYAEDAVVIGMMFWAAFAVCFVCYMARSAYNTAVRRNRRLEENKRLLSAVFVAMGVLWLSWFLMAFSDPVEMDIPVWARYAGLFVFFAGVSLFILSHVKLKGFEGKEKLVTGGIYSRIRNPMYLGFILWVVGFPIFTRSLITLASSAIWIPHLLYWKSLEEKELEEKFESYADYRKRTWF